MLKPEKETLAQVLAKHGHVIACPSCGTYVTMPDVDPAAIAAAYNRLELAKLVKAYATSTEPQALAITCVTCRREHNIGETHCCVGLAAAASR